MKTKFQVGCFLCILVPVSLASYLDVPSLLCLLLTVLFFLCVSLLRTWGLVCGVEPIRHSTPSLMGSTALLIIIY